MKDIHSAPGSHSCSAFWKDLCGYARQGRAALNAMPWPMLLACAIGLACIIPILPLAIALFAIFLLLKWAGNTSGSSRDKKTATAEHAGKRE